MFHHKSEIMFFFLELPNNCVDASSRHSVKKKELHWKGMKARPMLTNQILFTYFPSPGYVNNLVSTRFLSDKNIRQ